MAQNNNQDQQRDVQTRGFSSSNGNAKKPRAVEWSYQADMLRVLFYPELPENEQSEKRRYDYKNPWITAITRGKCIDLYEKFKKLVEPAAEKGEPKFISIPVGEVNQFGIGVCPNEKGDMTGYLKLIKNIDPKTLQSREVIEYEFRVGELIEDYDETTGKFGARHITDNEMHLFVKDLESFIMGSSKAFNHANRVVDKTYKDMIASDIRAIGNKVGAEMSTPYAAQRGGARYGQQSLFDTGAMNAPVEQISSLDDLDVQFEGES